MPPGETALERNQRLFGTTQPVAFVTGSHSPRVGQVVARYLEAENFRVVLHAHSQPTQEDASNDSGSQVPGLSKSSATAADQKSPMVLSGAIESEESVLQWKNQIQERYQRLDLLVNSAAIWQPKRLEETSGEDFERFFRVNALGTALTCKHFGLMMASQPTGGAIVNIGDWAAHRPYRDFAAYFTSKGGIVTLTQTMAVELATRNNHVRVNAVLPGPVMLDDAIDDERAAEIRNASLLKRNGSPDDVAQAVVFLALSPFVTGVCLPVDGGRTIYAGESSDPIAHPDV